MKISKFTVSAVAVAVLTSASMNASAERFTIQVDNNNKGIVKALAKKLGGDIHLDGNGFIAASFTNKDLSQVKGLLNNPHIKVIEVDQKRSLLSYSDLPSDSTDSSNSQITPYAVYQSQANQLSLADANMKVCVIDSGLDSTNDKTNADFDWNNISGSNDPGGTDNWYENGGPHGTHVAGTIAAVSNDFGVVGMAPGVALHIVKVFNADGWGYSSDLAYAAQKCTEGGANIISMSLGGGRANSVEENAFQAFTDNGGLVVAAAGNDGNNVRSYPAGYPSVMMIGANDAANNIADFSQYPNCGKGRRRDESTCVEVTAGGVDTLSTYPADTATVSNMTADGVIFASSAMDNLGSISGSTYHMGIADAEDGGANGKICVIDRGTISFHDKVENCQASGGVGAIIINNEAGMLYGTLGDYDELAIIPAVGAAFEDRAELLAAETASVSIGTSDYGYMSGTSMATPAVSGMAALIWSNHSSCTGTDIRNAIKETATGLGDRVNDKFGYGIVKAAAADAYLTTHGCAGSDGDEGGTDPEEPPVCRGGPKKCPNG